MSTLTIDTPWSDGATLTEAFLDNVKDDTELFVNVTGLTGADNIQAASIASALLVAGSVTAAKKAALGQQLSSSSSSFTSTDTAFVDVTNLTITITTVGRPVVLLLQPDGTSSGSSVGASSTSSNSVIGVVDFLRGTTHVASFDFIQIGGTTGSKIAEFPCGGAFHIDHPDAGTYTYKAQAKQVLSTSVEVTNCKLMAYEL